MLKKIPKELGPELLKVLSEMGHGDEIVLADANFPAASSGPPVLRADGLGCVTMLEAILQLFPLDPYAKEQVALMEVCAGDPYKPLIWEEFSRVLQASGEPCEMIKMERFAFYERARKAYAIVATGESALYANVILKKGVVKEGDSD